MVVVPPGAAAAGGIMPMTDTNATAAASQPHRLTSHLPPGTAPEGQSRVLAWNLSRRLPARYRLIGQL